MTSGGLDSSMSGGYPPMHMKSNSQDDSVRKDGLAESSPLYGQSDSGGIMSEERKKRRRFYVRCLLVTLWLAVGVYLCQQMWEKRHEIMSEEDGELKPWHFVNTEE